MGQTLSPGCPAAIPPPSLPPTVQAKEPDTDFPSIPCTGPLVAKF